MITVNMTPSRASQTYEPEHQWGTIYTTNVIATKERLWMDSSLCPLLLTAKQARAETHHFDGD